MDGQCNVLCLCSVTHSRSTLCDPWTVAPQAPLSVEFSRQEYWSGLPFPSPGDLPSPIIKPASPKSSALANGLFITEPPGKQDQCEAPPYIFINATSGQMLYCGSYSITSTHTDISADISVCFSQVLFFPSWQPTLLHTTSQGIFLFRKQLLLTYGSYFLTKCKPKLDSALRAYQVAIKHGISFTLHDK